MATRLKEHERMTLQAPFRRTVLLTGFIIGAIFSLLGAITPELTQPAFAAQLSKTSLQVPPGTVIHAPACLQPPAQAIRDRATYSPQELQKYGLPPRPANADLSRWVRVVRAATKRVCDRTISDIRTATHVKPLVADLAIYNWGGNIGDLGRGGTTDFSEIDMDYYEPCPDNQQESWESMWVGIGGYYTGNLVQTGTSVHRYWNGSEWFNDHEAFVENTAASNPGEQDLFTISCNDHMYVKVWNGNCMFVEDLNNGVNSGNQCYGPAADSMSAEAIAERPIVKGNWAPLADFHTETFYGVGVTYNGNYDSMADVPHDYSNMEADDKSHDLTSTGYIVNDPGDTPYDQFAQTWLALQ